MGPKVDAACRFTRATGKHAAIGQLCDLRRILNGEAGTLIAMDARHRLRPLNSRAPRRPWVSPSGALLYTAFLRNYV
jgi:hypothetical protein